MADEGQSFFEQLWKSLTFVRLSTLIGLLLLAALTYSVWRHGYKDLLDQITVWVSRSGDVGFARGLITSLVVLATVTIALTLVFGLSYSKNESFEKRFALGKDVLTIFIGLLGTIMGFYYAENRVSPENVQKIAESVQKTETSSVGDLEKKGFDALLSKDFDAAAKAFTEAYKSNPIWHNVDEINKLLNAQKDGFTAAAAANDSSKKETIWASIHCEISTKKLTVGMTREMIAKLQAACKDPAT